MALDEQRQREASLSAFERLRWHPVYRQADCVMGYMAVRGELSVALVLEDVLREGKKLALPVCEGPGQMSVRRVTSLSRLRRGAYGIWEPEDGCERLDPMEVDLLLVPGTAFDRHGGRIGQGGGYYDRFLPGMRGLRIGVCHGFALLERVPVREHDVRMDAILTPQEMIWLAGGETGEDRRSLT